MIFHQDICFSFVLVENKINPVPSPFHFLQENVTRVYMDNEANHLMGRLATPNGKLWLKFLPQVRNR